MTIPMFVLAVGLAMLVVERRIAARAWPRVDGWWPRAIAANLVQDAIGSEDNELVLIDDEGMHRLARSSKLHQARSLIRHITKLYKPSRKPVTAR